MFQKCRNILPANRLLVKSYTQEAKPNETPTLTHENPVSERVKLLKHSRRLHYYFRSTPHLAEIRQFIPDKYFQQKRPESADNLYLVDKEIARSIVRRIRSLLADSKQMICETSPGLGLICSELLETKVKMVRLYETCPEFRAGLRDIHNVFPGQVELYIKDIFQLHRISLMDQIDRHNRVDQLLKGVPRKAWKDAPAMSIIGTMPKFNFIAYLIKMVALQSEIVNYGRLQLFAIMRPRDYIKLSAGPELQNLHAYGAWSVLFNLLFDHKLMDKFPRNAFLPWEMSSKISRHTRIIKKIDQEWLYFVHITHKRRLPVDTEHLLPLYYFVKQLFGTGTNKVIPTIEKWIPGCGLRLLVPTMNHTEYYKNLSIYTQFGDLSPLKILAVFKEMIRHPGYEGSSFAAMVQSELLKSETRETSLNDDMPLNQELFDDLEDKMNM